MKRGPTAQTRFRQALLAAALISALALTGSAGADVFTIVPNAPSSPAAGLPSADVPNPAGSIAYSLTRPAAPQVLSYPQLLGVWQQAGAAYGIQWQALAAINKVESNFGRNMGPSSAGAIGWMQFMPSTWERWGVDANGDGVADPWNAEDAITSAARYLAASGGSTDISRAVFSYNHAQWYVDEVLQLARLFDSGGVQTTFTLARLQVSLDQARSAVVRANRKLVAEQRVARARGARERSLRIRAARAALLSDRLDLEQQAAQADVALAAAQARVAALRKALDSAQSSLQDAEQRSVSSSFSPAAGA